MPSEPATPIRPPRRRVFVEGLLSGVVGTLLIGASALYIADRSSLLDLTDPQAPMAGFAILAPALDWASANLGLSLPLFAIIALLFLHSLVVLRERVRSAAPVERVAQAEHLTDTWIALFFGIGVIWTAIGMRGALLFALGDPAGVREAGAFALLQRMVDGGILLALSTTIFGGIGGYLMRLVKTLTVGVHLRRYYQEAAGQAARANANALHETLLRIEQRLAGLDAPGAEHCRLEGRATQAVDAAAGNGRGPSSNGLTGETP